MYLQHRHFREYKMVASPMVTDEVRYPTAPLFGRTRYLTNGLLRLHVLNRCLLIRYQDFIVTYKRRQCWKIDHRR
jgi:hypothetical protein